MRPVSIISELTGVTTTVSANTVNLTGPSVVKLQVERSEIASIVRNGQDMIVTLHSGETLTVKNFYATNSQGESQLVLEDNQGALWWVQDTAGAYHFEHVATIDEVIAAGSSHAEGGAFWPWAVAGIAAVGIGAAAASTGGGGGGGSDNNNGGNGNGNGNNGGNGNSNGGTGQPGSADTTPPAAPTGLAVSADGKTVTGQAEAGSTVTIKDPNGDVIGQGTAGSDGSFTIGLTTPQLGGETLTATATDPAGNTGPGATVTAPDVPLPDDPSITGVLSHIGAILSELLNGQFGNDNLPTLKGRGEVGSTIHIFDNGHEIGSVAVNADGTWSFTPGTALPDGSHAFTVIASNIRGDSGVSASFTVNIDTVNPDAPVLSQVGDDQGSIIGPVGNNGVTDDTQPLLNGTGEVNDKVTIFDNGVKIGETTVDSNGNWSFTPGQPLDQGSHTITVQQTDPAGNNSALSSGITFTVDTTPPPPVTINSISLDGTTVTGTAEIGSIVTIVGAGNIVLGTAQADASGNFTITLVPAQTHGQPLTAEVHDVAGNDGPNVNFVASSSGFPTVPVLVSVTDNNPPNVGALNNGQSTNDNTPTLTGTAEVGSTVRIFDNGVLIDIAIVDGSGNWSWTSPGPLPDITHQFTLDAFNINGLSGTSSSFSVVVDTQPPVLPTGLAVSDDGLTVTGTAEAGSTVTIKTTGGTVLGTATADDTGHFSAALSPAQLNHQILSVSATDAAGNTGPAAPVIAPDHTAPDAPGNLQVSADGLHVTGTAEAGSTITITDGNGTVIGVGIALPGGTFDVTPLLPPQLNGQTLLVTATDAATNASPPGSVAAPDITPPLAPTDLAVNLDGTVVSGKAEAGSTVKVTDSGGQLLGTGTAQADGSFSVTIAPAQTNGQLLEVFATDRAGNPGPDAPVTAHDTTAPNVPVILTVADNVPDFVGNLTSGALTNDDKPTLTGTAEGNATLKIYDNGTLLATIPLDASGSWSYTPTTALSQGLHNLTVTATDASGNISPAASFSIVVDSVLPQAPLITLVSDDTSPVLGAVANNGATNDTTPTISGTGEPGSTVTLFDGGSIVTTLTVTPQGTWSYTPTTPYINGSIHVYTVSAEDAAGNTTALSAPFTITVDTTPPSAPGIVLVNDDVGVKIGPVAPEGSTDDTKPTFSGSGDAGSTISLYDGTTLIGKVVVGILGTWEITPDLPLSEGAHTLKAIATDTAGNASAAASFVLNIDTTPPGAPQIISALGNVGGTPTTLYSGGSTQSLIPQLSGKAEAGSTVAIYDNNNPIAIGTVTVQGDGTWTFNVPLLPGNHVLTAIATDAAGNTGIASASFTLTVDTVGPGVPATPIVTDDQLPVVGSVSNLGSTNDTTPTFSGTGTAGDTIKIYNNLTDLIGTTTVRADGSWSYTPGAPLGQATYNITVVESDPAGNASLPSAPIIFTIDTTPPVPPTILNGDDNVGGSIGLGVITSGTVTDDNTPVFHGTGIAGSTVTLYNGSTVIGTGTVDVLNNWTITPTTALTDGAYTLTAIQTDAAGNASTVSNTFTVTVNTTPLTMPVVTSIDDNVGLIQNPLVNGSVTDDPTPTFHGTGSVGSTVTLMDGPATLGTALVGADGTWTITPTLSGQTTHTLTLTASDPMGNNIGPTLPIVITLDTTPPPAPLVLPVTDSTGTLISGTAEPGVTVIIKDNLGNVLGTAVALPVTGLWTATISPAQTTGAALTAQAQDPAGNLSGSTSFSAITSGLPHPPSIDQVYDDIGPVTGNVLNGKATNDLQPLLSGSGAAANATVHIYVDGTERTTVTADASGNWSYQIASDLGQGSHTFAVSQTTGGLTSGQSGPYTIVVDNIAPNIPVVVTVADDVLPNVGNLSNNGVTNDPRPVLSGTADVGATVTILDNGAPIGTAVANALGFWTFTPGSDLSEGAHSLTVTATDAAGNVSDPTTAFAITVDTLAPATPVVLGVTNDITATPIVGGQPTNDNTPTLNGTAEAGTTLTIKDNGVTIGTVNVVSPGTWTFTPSTPLGEGSHSLTITATDAAGNVSGATTAISVVVDTVAPVVPTITTVIDDRTQPGTPLPLGNGQLTKDTQPTLNGSSEANATITIKDGANVIGTTRADGSGNWSFTPPLALGQGSHSLTVTATDAAGNVSNPSSSFGVMIDSIAPTAPVIVTVMDNTAPVTGPITSGIATNETRPALSGTGEVGATITVYSDGVSIGTTTVAAGGGWNFTPAAGLLNGSHTLTVTATDAAGNVSPASGGFTLLVDTINPLAPSITQVVDDVGSITGNLSTGQVTDDSLPVINGSAEANATITVYNNGVAIGTTQANGSGAWSFTPTVALTNGSHTLTVTATDAAGNVSPPSTGFVIIVDTIAPGTPVVIQAYDDVGPVIGPLANGQATNDTQPALSGTAEANSIVKIYDNGTLIGTVNASATGTWGFTPGSALSQGLHVFTATSTDAAGNLGTLSATFTLTIDSAAPNTPVLLTVIDDVAGGVFNGPLANGQLTNDARPTLNGTAEANSTVSVYDGNTLVGTTSADASGNWSFTPGTALSSGSHTLTVTATDAAGNVSTATAGFTVVVDTAAPGTPTITSIVNDVGSVTGPVGNNQPTNDTLPTLNGSAEAGATVTILDNGVAIGTATANGSGAWTFTPTVPLSQGTHAFTVTAADAAGNASAASVPSTIIVDTTPPPLPTGLTVNGTGTTVTGSAEANSTVTVTSATGTVLGTAKADGNGSFTLTLSPAQTSGQALLAYAQDVAGNTGLPAAFTAPFTGVPGVPVITSIYDDFAPLTGALTPGQSTNDNTPTLSGTAQAGSTVSLYNNGVLMGTVGADVNGNWSYTPGSGLGEGLHAFTATATNANGTSSPSVATSIIVDTIAPPIPTAVVSADGTTVTGTAEANSTVTITLPGGLTATGTANGSGAYSITLPVRQISGDTLGVIATDAAGNPSPSLSINAPTLPVAASSNVVDLALTSSAQITTAHSSGYGVLLVGALGNVASVLGSNTAQASFTIANGATGHVTIDAAATGVVLSLINTLEVAIQKFDAATNSWSTVIDSSLPQFANLLTLGATGVQLNVDGLAPGTYRVVGYNTSLLATGAVTSLDVSLVQTTNAVVGGETSHTGNAITDPGPTGTIDTAPTGTLVTAVSFNNGTAVAVGASGTTIQGKYGSLQIFQDGHYTYTLNTTDSSVLGRTENFSYTITRNGISDTAQLVITLGTGAPASTVTATDDTGALTYGTSVVAIDHGTSQQSGLTVLSVGVGTVVNLNLLANMTNPVLFNVDDGSTRTIQVQASVGGVALLSTFDLYVLKFNDITQQYEQYQVVKTWLTAPLLGGSSSPLTVTLPGGEYLFLLSNASGVAVATAYTMDVLQDHTYAIDSQAAVTTGNVMQDDIAPVGSHLTMVNGVNIAATGTTTIVGKFGVLTIDAQGNYTYTLKSGLGANGINTPDSFVYTVTAPNGDTGTASLNITATPHSVDAVNDISSLMSVATAQNTAAYSDTSVGSASWSAALLSATHGNGSGTFVVDPNTVLHNGVLQFAVNSLLPLGGVSVSWTLSDGLGYTLSGTFNGSSLLNGVFNVNLNNVDLHSGTWTLSYVGNAGALGVGNITVTPNVTGTAVDLTHYSTLAGSTVHGNLYDGSGASGAADQLSSVHTLLTITGVSGSTATLDPLNGSATTATINGHYGTLTIGVDGSYTYTLNAGISPSSINSQEVFTYVLNDQSGHSDSATLTINMNPQFTSTAQNDTIAGSAYGDTMIYHLLNSADATGGNGSDTWTNFSLSQPDKINVSELLTGWDHQASTLGNYIQVNTVGSNTVIAIDRDGTGSTYHSTTLITLNNVQTNLQDLINQNHLITG